MSDNKLVWVDIETTGLDPEEDFILELGIIITDQNLDLLAQRTWIFSPYMDKSALELSFTVIEMHTKNGLWVDWARKANDVLDHAKENKGIVQDVCSFLEKEEALGLPMAGSTINFDRGFLRLHFPEIHALFHYRNIDVSTVKNLARIYRPYLYETAPMPEEKAHRPLADLQASIAELRHYLEGMKWML